MATKQVAAGEDLAAQVNGMSRSEMYDMMSQMKKLIDHDQETVRRMLVDNPDVTRALFRAQVALGMVKTPKPAQSSEMAQPAPAPGPAPAPASAAPSSVKASAQDHVSLPQPPLPSYQQGVAQHSGPLPSALSNVASTIDLPTMPANPPQSAQTKGYTMHQMPTASIPQSFQHPNMTLPHAPPQYSNPPSHMPAVHSQAQQPLQNPGMFNQQLQPPLPPLPRPPAMQSFAHQMHTQANSFGMAHANAPQHILQQSLFHPGGNPQTSFLASQPPLPNQPPPQLYQATSHYTSQSTTPMQVDRSAPWGWGPEASAAGSHFPGQLPGLTGQLTQGIGGIQTGQAPLTPEMEKMLVQQVLGMSPEQINMLPPEQRQQVLQLRDMLRQ